MRSFVIKQSQDEVPIEEIAMVLQEDYRRPPWNEDRMCPACKSFDDFGPRYTYGLDGPMLCVACGGKLVPFWSEQRFAHYITLASSRQGFLFLEAWEQNWLSGWLWGYDMSEGVFYIDVYAAAPDFRGIPSNSMIVRKMIHSWRDLDHDALGRFAHDEQMPVPVALFLKLSTLCAQRGYQQVMTRTHREATRVKSLLKIAGFAPVDAIVGSDPERQYWQCSL